jgi:hypothetical protein
VVADGSGAVAERRDHHDEPTCCAGLEVAKYTTKSHAVRRCRRPCRRRQQRLGWTAALLGTSQVAVALSRGGTKRPEGNEGRCDDVLGRHALVEWRVLIQRRGHHGHVVLPDPRREGAGPAPPMLRPMHTVPSGLERSTWSMLKPSPPLSVSPRRRSFPARSKQPSAPSTCALHQAGVVLARVRGPGQLFSETKR